MNNFLTKIDPLGRLYGLAICMIFVYRNVLMMFWNSKHCIPNLNVMVCAEVETPKFPFKEGFTSKMVLDKNSQIRELPRKWRSSSSWELRETVSEDYDSWQPDPPSEQRSAGDSGLEVGNHKGQWYKRLSDEERDSGAGTPAGRSGEPGLLIHRPLHRVIDQGRGGGLQ